MARVHRLSTIGALIVCLVGTQWSGTLFASEQEPLSTSTISVDQPPPSVTDLSDDPAVAPHIWRSALKFAPVESGSYAQRRWGRGGGGRNGGAQAALVLGAIGTIAGAALLVYANRPECSTNQMAGGCGYGAKVVGGAVLGAGIVGLVAGALTWR